MIWHDLIRQRARAVLHTVLICDLSWGLSQHIIASSQLFSHPISPTTSPSSQPPFFQVLLSRQQCSTAQINSTQLQCAHIRHALLVCQTLFANSTTIRGCLSVYRAVASSCPAHQAGRCMCIVRSARPSHCLTRLTLCLCQAHAPPLMR